MTTKAEKDRVKQIQDKCQALLTEMLRDEDNKYCVDCDAKGPRWASWNLGIFLCIRCAGIHRNLGVHISKVKSVNLDTWTPEQVVSLQQMGNSRARAVYEANIPDNFRRPQTDSSLEAFVRAKYEHKKYIAKEWVPQPIPKINWDRELDEEAERQKKRKKDAKTQQQIRKPDGVVPQLLPKPKSSSPKPSVRSSPIISADAYKSPKSASQDLLGLDTPTSAKSLPGVTSSSSNGEDIFSSFLSAPPAPAPQPDKAPTADKSVADSTKGRSAEEESFFNQPAPTNQEKRQLTKDSILALYSTAPAQNTQANPNPMFGIPGGVYTQPAPGGFPVQPPAGMPYGMPNGMMGGAAPQMQNGPFGQQVAQPGVASNPFFSMGGASPAPHGFPQMTQEHVVLQNPNQDLMCDFSALAASQHYTTPKAQLPQQMGRMNLGGPTAGGQPQGMMAFQQNPPMGMQMPLNNTVIGSFPAPTNPGHTLATNLWQ